MSPPYLQNALKKLEGVPYFINGTTATKANNRRLNGACVSNTVAIFFAVIRYSRPVPFLLVADLLETFSKDCVKELKATRSFFFSS